MGVCTRCHEVLPAGRTHHWCKDCLRQYHIRHYASLLMEPAQTRKRPIEEDDSSGTPPPERTEVEGDSINVFQCSRIPRELKIGRSCDVLARAATLQRSMNFRMNILAHFPHAGHCEKYVHKLLNHCRVIGVPGRECFACELSTACGAISLALQTDGQVPET